MRISSEVHTDESSIVYRADSVPLGHIHFGYEIYMRTIKSALLLVCTLIILFFFRAFCSAKGIKLFFL